LSTHQPSPPQDSLVLYKQRPARVLKVGEKIEIELDAGQTKRVRAKDLDLLHPGPLGGLGELKPQAGEPEEAWSLLEGSETTLKELAELIYGAFNPATAWAAWQLAAEGLHFAGVPALIRARPREEVQRDLAELAAERDWSEFLARMAAAAPEPRDAPRLAEVERLALGQGEHSRILVALGQEQTPEQAHRALIRVGHWDPRRNPYPQRCRVVLGDPGLPVPELATADRLDLRGLPAYAIDDEGNRDPDDAVSLDGDRVWVHVADVAALVDADGPIEREARARGANLYAPEGVVNMLPEAVTERLGLGLHEVSPALSFSFRCDASGALGDLRVQRTWIRAERLSYEAAEGRLGEEPFAGLTAIAERFRAARVGRGASGLELPEVSVRVLDGEVVIRPLPRLASRTLVAEAMLMAGEAAARLCLELGLPIPFATQAPPDDRGEATDLASQYARRRGFKPTRLSIVPEPHSGLGLPLYTRATSPLRRYCDLLVHQQLGAWLAGTPPLCAERVSERIAESEAGALAIRRAERFSNLHWKLVYLAERPHWRGEGVVVANEERKGVVLIPELALETRLRFKEQVLPNDRLKLALREVDIPAQTVGFRVLG
jgi:exoribonuclease-2